MRENNKNILIFELNNVSGILIEISKFTPIMGSVACK